MSVSFLPLKEGIWFVFGFDRNCKVCLENGNYKRTQYYYESREFSLKKTRANKVLSVNSKLSYTHQVLKLVTVIELSVRSLYLHSYSLLQLLNMAFRDSFWKSFVRESLFINVDSLLLTPTRRQLFSLSNS